MRMYLESLHYAQFEKMDLANIIDRKIIKFKLEPFLNPTKTSPKDLKIGGGGPGTV